MNKSFCLVFFLIGVGYHSFGQMKTGTNPTTMNSNAIFEMESLNKGVLLPRLQLVSDTSSLPLSAHVAGMMVYNTDTAGLGNNRVFPGVYFNDGTKWIQSFSKAAPQLLVDRKLVPISTNGQTLLNLPLGFPDVDNDFNFFLYRNGVLLMKDVDYSIISPNQIQIINSSFSLTTSDELYAILKTIKL